MHKEQQYLQWAIDIAYEHHSGILRKGVKNRGDSLKIPYIWHALGVMSRAWKWGINKPEHYIELSTYVLHDTLEDPNASGEKLTSGSLASKLAPNPKANVIVDHVLELTHDESMPKAEYMATFHHKSLIALVGKVADRFCNVEDWHLVDPAYALKYYHKADVLWEALYARESEIEKRYGKPVLLAIDHEHQVIRRLIGDR